MRTLIFEPVSGGIFSRQFKITVVVVVAVFAFLIFRLWFLQIINGPMYRARSERNRIQLKDIPAPRGHIYDRKGKVLVTNKPSYSLCVIPEDVQDNNELLEKLEGLIGLDRAESARKMAESSHISPFRPVYLDTDLSRDELAVIETLNFNLPGVVIRVRPKRYYPLGDSASHLLGYMGEISENQLKSGRFRRNKQGDMIGKAGVEAKWQSHLNGIRGGEQIEADAEGRKLRILSRKLPVPGDNVYLTIDRGLQEIAERALRGRKGAVVALDPNGGQLLAIASSPSFDPNLFSAGIERDKWKKIATSRDFPMQNRALTGQYSPGSVFKIVMSLAGLKEGVINPREAISCKGAFRFGNRIYRCWKKYGHGRVAFHKAMRESCDVYFYTIGRRLGITKIAEYAKILGMGRPAGCDVGSEKSGLVPTKAWKLRRFGVPWQRGETISTSIGQSFVLATPIQMASLIAAVFNGGVLYRPQATLRIEKADGRLVGTFVPEIRSQMPFSNEHLKIVKKALIAVVNEPHGTGWRARMKNVTVAGKTGTAQVITLDREKALNKRGKLPEKFRDHAWFVAVAPAEDPLIAVSVVIEHGGHGGSAAAPVAGRVIRAYLNIVKNKQFHSPRRGESSVSRDGIQG